MNEFDAVIDFGFNNLRIGVFDSQSKSIYSSKVSLRDSLNIKDTNNYLNELIRDTERHLSIHLSMSQPCRHPFKGCSFSFIKSALH